MGKIQGLFQFNGRVGNVVGRKGRNGYYTASIHQRVVHQPNTIMQQNVKNRMKSTARDFGAFKQIVKKYFEKTNDLPPYHSFLKYNYPEAVTPALSDTNIQNAFKISYDKLLISMGPIDLPYSPVGSLDGSDINASWTDNTGLGNAWQNDHPALVVYNVQRQTVLVSVQTSVKRSDRSTSVTTPTSWSGDNVEVYLFMVGGEDAQKEFGKATIASKSVYLGNFTL